MKTILKALGWLFGLLFFLLSGLALFSGQYLPAVVMLIAVVFLIPPFRKKLRDISGISLPFWLRCLVVPLLFFLFVYLIFAGMGNKSSIYRNPEIEKGLMEIY